MLESSKDSKREAFRAAIERARQDGLSADEMASMITAADNTERSPGNGSVQPTELDDVIYEPGELPEGLIDLPSASKKYGIKPATLRMWIQRGRLPRCGRLRGPSPGRGYIVTVEADIEYCRDNPRKPWHNKSVTS